MSELDQLHVIIDKLRSEALDEHIRSSDSQEAIETIEYCRGIYDTFSRVLKEIRKLQFERKIPQ